MKKRVLAFLVIAISCAIGACIHVRSLEERHASAASTPRPASPSPSRSNGIYLDYVAIGKAPINQRRYRFRICNACGEYLAYILSMPDYGSRDKSLTVTYRKKSKATAISCAGPRRLTQRELDAVVSLWTRATVMYIELGGNSTDRYAERLMRE